MKIKGIRLITWLRHPKICWQSLKNRKAPVVNLDNEENNCSICGYDRDYISPDNKHHYCKKCQRYLQLKIELNKAKNET